MCIYDFFNDFFGPYLILWFFYDLFMMCIYDFFYDVFGPYFILWFCIIV